MQIDSYFRILTREPNFALNALHVYDEQTYKTEAAQLLSKND